jgi:hypothetical protein
MQIKFLRAEVSARENGHLFWFRIEPAYGESFDLPLLVEHVPGGKEAVLRQAHTNLTDLLQNALATAERWDPSKEQWDPKLG